MTIFGDGPRLEPESIGIHEVPGGVGDYLGAKAGQAVDSMPVVSLGHINELSAAQGQVPISEGMPAPQDLTDWYTNQPETSIADARQRVKEAGLEQTLHLPEQPTIKTPALEIMLNRARAKRERDVAIARGPDSYAVGALGVGTSFFIGALDPLNVASAFVPVMGEMRFAKLMADAGTSVLARARVRTTVGAASGALGQTLVEPIEAWARTQEGQDYTMADALRSVMFGAALGGGLHVGGGAIADIVRGRKGTPLYPFAPGEPHFKPIEGLGTHVPGSVLAEGGVTAEQLHAPAPVSAWDSHVAALDDLPPRAKEDLLRGAIASLHDGKPVSAWEQLMAGAKADPRIAESIEPIEAWHGSPHDFDRFDIARVGSGEGAQSYGRGLYFAEAEGVARTYQEMLKRPGFIKIDGVEHQGHTAEGFAARSLLDNGYASTRSFIDDAVKGGIMSDYWRAAGTALEKFKDAKIERAPEEGVLYKVRITANKEHFLDWDKPLSEQPPDVQAALRKAGWDVDRMGDRTGADVLHLYESSFPGGQHQGGEEASRRLLAAGIPGIKYLDQGSRRGEPADVAALREEVAELKNRVDRGETRFQQDLDAARRQLAIAEGHSEPTRNFVVFDDKHVEITEKNGKPVKRADVAPAPGKASNDAIWANKDADLPVKIADEPPQRGPDGRLYQRVEFEGKSSFVPLDELRRPDGGSVSNVVPLRPDSPVARPAPDPADWHDLANQTRDFDEPDVLAASRAAEKLPEPASVAPEPNKRIQEAEAAATEAEAQYRAASAYWDDELRQALDERFKASDQELADRTELIQRGANCLAQARG